MQKCSTYLISDDTMNQYYEPKIFEEKMYKICKEIYVCVMKYTSLNPSFYFKDTSLNVILEWRIDIPDEATISEIETALTQFGTPVVTYVPEKNFASFIIFRS